jgi:hypothetical protein
MAMPMESNTNNADLVAQGVDPKALPAAAAERLTVDRETVKILADEQRAYGEKRRLDYIAHEKEKLDHEAKETAERADWDKRASDAATKGPKDAAALARTRWEWESKLVFDRSQRELAWESQREHEEREFEDKRQVKVDEWTRKVSLSLSSSLWSSLLPTI